MRYLGDRVVELRVQLLEMSRMVESAIYRSVQSLVEKEERQARQVLENESRINQMETEIDDLATRLLTLGQAIAPLLRYITAAIKITDELESMGDVAVNIAERSLLWLHEPVVNVVIDIPHMANLAQSMVRKGVDGFVTMDGDLARSVLVSRDAVNDLQDAIRGELMGFMQGDAKNIRQGVDLLFVLKDLERIADQASNIAESLHLLVEGVEFQQHAEAFE